MATVAPPMPDTDTQDQLPQDTAQTQDQPKQDLGKWNEKLDEKLQKVIVDLAAYFCDEFRYPRRLEVMKAWQARSFWREMQHLNWNWDGECWDVWGPAGAKDNSGSNSQLNSAVLYSTNTYQGFGKLFLAVITQSVPNLRFEPEDPEEAADIETAKEADSIKKFIQHENDPIKLMTKAAYYAWTDGRIHGWTRWEIDPRTKQPREMQSIEGVMEVKVPVIYDDQCEFPYLQYSKEHHLSTTRAKVKARDFPADYWKKIKGGSHGNGQDVYERTARISIKQGISMRSAGGDAYAHLVTCQRTWMRPTVFLDDKCPDEFRDDLEGLFPNGCYVEVDNGIYTGSRDANMDDEWVVENIMEGDGSSRNAQGTCLISVQERTNDIINITQDVYEKTIPSSHWDDKLYDVDAMNKQKSVPGRRDGVNMSELQPGDTLEAHAFFEPPASVSADMLQYLKELMTDIPEGLTGLSAVLLGADTGGDKSGKALSIQQSAAMGIIGLPFRVLKRMYAGMMEQAIRCASRNRQEDATMGIPDESGEIETLVIRIGDLAGKVRCYPDSDENYPESWMQKRQTYMNLLAMAKGDPILSAILASPENQNLAKKMIGLQEMTIPDAASWNKQLVEINLLLEEPPPPTVQPPPEQVPNPMQPETMETVQPPPVQASSIPIDPEYDNNSAEFLTVTIWINSSKGQKAKKVNPAGFENVRLHGLEHKQALQAAMAPPAPPMGGQPPAAPPKPAQAAT